MEFSSWTHIHLHLHLPSTPVSPVIVAPNGLPARHSSPPDFPQLEKKDPPSVDPMPTAIQNAVMILRSHFASEIGAILLGCFVLQTRDKKREILTSELTVFLREKIGGYAVANIATLIRSIVERRPEWLKIFGKQKSWRHELIFALTPQELQRMQERLSS